MILCQRDSLFVSSMFPFLATALVGKLSSTHSQFISTHPYRVGVRLLAVLAKFSKKSTTYSSSTGIFQSLPLDTISPIVMFQRKQTKDLIYG